MGTVGVAAGGQPPRARSICVSHLLLYPPQGSRTAVVGVPDMGAVCTKTHVPGYIASLAALRAAGVDRVLVVAPGDPTIKAVASDSAHPDLGCPLFDLNATGAIADFILSSTGLARDAG